MDRNTTLDSPTSESEKQSRTKKSKKKLFIVLGVIAFLMIAATVSQKDSRGGDTKSQAPTEVSQKLTQESSTQTAVPVQDDATSKKAAAEIPAGFTDNGGGLASQLVATPTCDSSYFKCMQVEVVAYNDCSTIGVTVEGTALDAEKRIIGSVFAYPGKMKKGERALVTLTALEDKTDTIRVDKFSCI